MNNILNVKNKCLGCMKCFQTCPKQAIEFKLNKYGFYEPIVNKKLCINCGLCLKQCTALCEDDLQDVIKEIVCWSNDKETRLSCSSGGAFFEIAKKFILNNGVVYGAAFSSPYAVEHIRASKADTLENIKGSKYIQSNICNSIKLLKLDLDNGKNVLFSGTPCQVAVIKSLFGNYKNLYLVDVICFGFISNGVYQNYLKGIEKIHSSKIKKVIFRDSFHQNMMHIELENGKHYYYQMRDNPENGIYKFFTDRSLIKEACSTCKFRSEKRVGDLSLSDYPYVLSDEIDNKREGVSIIYINNEKGFDLVNNVNLHVVNDNRENLISNFKNNYNLELANKNRNKFFKNYFRYQNNNKKLVSYIDSYHKKTCLLNKIMRYIKRKIRSK
ncbi:MAG: Coenzyme F420 hydrogenase/dehydrogenase, beta subunit C-terminal domain [archaeon]|nr:Coenzyme F420 hydrogenase/dehydrogenase, beta subunit C-terminal domain [archaeon]